jgi:hypothetical protein
VTLDEQLADHELAAEQPGKDLPLLALAVQLEDVDLVNALLVEMALEDDAVDERRRRRLVAARYFAAPAR